MLQKKLALNLLVQLMNLNVEKEEEKKKYYSELQ